MTGEERFRITFGGRAIGLVLIAQFHLILPSKAKAIELPSVNQGESGNTNIKIEAKDQTLSDFPVVITRDNSGNIRSIAIRDESNSKNWTRLDWPSRNYSMSQLDKELRGVYHIARRYDTLNPLHSNSIFWGGSFDYPVVHETNENGDIETLSFFSKGRNGQNIRLVKYSTNGNLVDLKLSFKNGALISYEVLRAEGNGFGFPSPKLESTDFNSIPIATPQESIALAAAFAPVGLAVWHYDRAAGGFAAAALSAQAVTTNSPLLAAMAIGVMNGASRNRPDLKTCTDQFEGLVR